MAMVRALVPISLCLLAACEQQRPSLAAMADDPVLLSGARKLCANGRADERFCDLVEQADLQRFLSGQSGPTEYRSLAGLPAIPASFDDPAQVQP